MKRKEVEYFGKDCEYFSGHWERDGRPPSKKHEKPILIYCDHRNNPAGYEGNCCEKLCPLRKKK